MIAVIIKPFVVSGEPLSSGSLVDVTDWRNTANLLKGRHIREASAAEIKLYQSGKRTIRTDAQARASKPAKPAKGAKTRTKNAAPKTTRGKSAQTKTAKPPVTSPELLDAQA